MLRRFGWEWLDVVFSLGAFGAAVVSWIAPAGVYLWLVGTGGVRWWCLAGCVLAGAVCALASFIFSAWLWNLVECFVCRVIEWKGARRG